MTSEMIAWLVGGPFLLFFLVYVASFIWCYYLSPKARARSKAYDLGLDAALNGDEYAPPFESSALLRGFHDGYTDGERALRLQRDKKRFKKDLQHLKK
jgi:hypothetical protein